MKKTILCMSLFFVGQAWALSCKAPVLLSQPGERSGNSKIAINDQGEAVVLWITIDDEKDEERLSSAVFGKDKKWSIAGLSQPVEDIDRYVPFIDAKGTAYAIWNNDKTDAEGNEKECCEFAKKEKDSSWTSPIDLLESDKILNNPKVVFDSQGNVILYGVSQIDQESLTSLVYRHQSGEKKVTELAKNTLYGRKITRNAQGKVFAYWFEMESGFNQEKTYYSKQNLVGAWLQEDLTWSKPEQIYSMNSSDSIYHIELEITPSGNLAMLWRREDKTKEEHKIQTVTYIDHQWSAPVDLAVSKNYCEDFKIAFNDAGHIVAWWTPEEENEIYFAAKSVGQPWSSPLKLSDELKRVHDFNIALDEAGNTIIVWISKEGKRWVPHAAYKPVGQDWMPAVSLGDGTGDCGEMKVCSKKGSFIVLWGQRKGLDISIQGAAFSTKTLEWTSSLLSPPKQPCWNFSFVFNEDGKGVIVWQTTEDFEEVHIEAAEISLD